MAQFHHGISGREVQSGIIPMRDAQTNIIAMIAYADDADPFVFPENVPVRVSSINQALTSAGVEGNLRKNLEIMALITNPTLIVVRIPDPFNGEVFNASTVIGTTAPLIGRTGIQALLVAKSILGLTPKIIIAPELESPDVVEALASVCKKLRAYCYITPRDANAVMLATAELVATYRDTLAHREIEIIWPEFTSGNVFLGAELGE
jgi:phage tail sheath protein FI